MNNQEVCMYLKNHVDPHINRYGNEYVADEFVKGGYGQSCGGYLKNADPNGYKDANPSQLDHFIHYYGAAKRNLSQPTYASLHCPQLMLWIAEVAGLSIDKLQDAKVIIMKFEHEGNLKGSLGKHGSYLDRQVKKEFKKKLRIGTINKIIRESCDWDEVVTSVSKL